MTVTQTTSQSTSRTAGSRPAVLGGRPRFAGGLPLVRPALGDPAPLAEEIHAILVSGMLTNGPTVRRLEEVVAERLGVPHVVAVASCTSGLALTLQALGVRGGSVVLPSFTFSASAHAIHWAGATPHFVEVGEGSLTLDPEAARAGLADLGPGAAAMTATHVYGTPCRTEALQAVADGAGVPLVYDAAHALGSVRQGVPVGGFGAAEVFSLSPTKVVVGGEGGLVTTHDPDLAQRVRHARDYGNPGDYDCLFPGLNARMSEMHAATALHSLALLEDHLERRRSLVRLFWATVGEVPGLRGPVLDEGDVSTYKDLTLVLDSAVTGLAAEELGRALRHDGIDSRRYYYPPIHRQQAYRHLDPVDLPLTDRLAESVLSPPLWSQMSEDDVVHVAEVVRDCLADPEAVRAALTRAG